MSHFVERCEHGRLVRQCRCIPANGQTKVERTVPCPPSCSGHNASVDFTIKTHTIMTAQPGSHGEIAVEIGDAIRAALAKIPNTRVEMVELHTHIDEQDSDAVPKT